MRWLSTVIIIIALIALVAVAAFIFGKSRGGPAPAAGSLAPQIIVESPTPSPIVEPTGTATASPTLIP